MEGTWHKLMISLVEEAQFLFRHGPQDSHCSDKNLLQQKTLLHNMSWNPCEAAGDGQQHSPSVGRDRFRWFSTEQAEVTWDDVEVFQLRLDFGFFEQPVSLATNNPTDREG